MHSFTLQNGAHLRVYASPFTPALGAWGFQYHPDKEHDFSISEEVDIAITHGPPKGVMDYTCGRERGGCSQLFNGIAHARPRIHCFGHIHEAWGAKLVAWQDKLPDPANHFNAINNNESVLIEKLAGLKSSRFETEDDVERRLQKIDRYDRDRCCTTSHCVGDEHPLSKGEKTLFINASILGNEDMPLQKPWLVTIDLPRPPHT